MKYKVVGFNICAGKKYIATLFPNDALVIMEGMDIDSTIKKIVDDCPEFCAEYNITKNYYPKIGSGEFFTF